MILCLGGVAATADDAAQAAARSAEQQYGGRVLKVEKKKGAYRVKLLQPSGKVKIVRVPDPSSEPDEPGAGRANDDGAKRK